MVLRHSKLIYAYKNGRIVCIEDVESGLKCGCVCPACGNPLIARKGPQVMHHFAHHAEKNCEYGYETSLHLAAKDILSKAQRIMLPPVLIHFPNSNKSDILLSKEIEIPIDHVELEKSFGSIIPDVVVYSGSKKLFIEIFVTHSIDAVKLSKLQKANISTIEIDLSKKDDTISVNELTSILLGDSEEKKWKFNSIAAMHLNRFYSIADKRKIINRGFTEQIENCPIRARVWHGKPYANLIHNCLECDYCISYSFENGLLCSGRTRISSLEDFAMPDDVRIQKSNERLLAEKYNMIQHGKCPNCNNGELIHRESQYGPFQGCSNYPRCKFKAYIDYHTGEIRISG